MTIFVLVMDPEQVMEVAMLGTTVETAAHQHQKPHKLHQDNLQDQPVLEL